MEAGDDFMLNIVEDKPRKKTKEKEAKIELSTEKLIAYPVAKKSEQISTSRGSKNNFNFKQSPKKNKNKVEKSSFAESGSEHIKTSSIFNRNPEIPALKVDKQKGISEPLFSKKKFEGLDLHPHLVSCLKSRLEVETLTNVQEKTIPVVLSGKDCLVKSCTGSGKTLAYAVPIVQKIQEISPKIKRSDGIFCLIIVPTRELALQCYECFSTLTKAFTWIVPGYLIGGEKKKSEKARLRKGINILICTPGRLLDHLDSTACLTLEKIQWLVVDEADKLLEQGFEESVTKIVLKSPSSRQSVLLSATLSSGVERLAGISLTNPAHIDVASKAGSVFQEFEEFALPSSLKQSIVIVPTKLRLAVMSAYIVDQFLQNKFKGLIFMCSLSSVDFHYSLLTAKLSPLLKEKGHKCKFFRLHGNMKQEERTEVFNMFRTKERGILLCTDVAARGLDLPLVDWILQYSAPPSPEIYIHRVGRTARIGKQGTALLFLMPSEVKFPMLLSQHKIQFDEIDHFKILQSLMLIGNNLTNKAQFSVQDCATALQIHYEKEVYTEKELHESAKEAFASYVQSYASYPKHVRETLPFKALHLGHVAKSFCLREAPSELGCRIPNAKYKQKTQNFKPQNFKPISFRQNVDKKPLKRKPSLIVSEFDSGLSALKHIQAPKRRKMK